MASPTRGRTRRHTLNQQAFVARQGRREAQPSKVAPQDERYRRSCEELAFSFIGFVLRS